MPSADRLLAFAVVAVIFVAVPGPSVLFTISRALTLGKRPALLTVVGNAAGVYVHVGAVAFGVAAIVERSVLAFTVLKFAGAAYLVYLGAQALRHRRRLSAVPDGHFTGVVRPRKVLIDGFVVGVTNPKSIVFFAAILPQFVTPANGHITSQLLVLGLVAISAALVCDSIWAMIAGTARDWFARSPRRLEAIGGAGGVVMMGLGVQLALTGRKD
ncbi:MAG TPA: LysE family translocator [Jiangellaceae bacterium]